LMCLDVFRGLCVVAMIVVDNPGRMRCVTPSKRKV
jgi:predicted acyltransferase